MTAPCTAGFGSPAPWLVSYARVESSRGRTWPTSTSASIRSALSALVRRFDHPVMNQLFDPASELPDEYRSKILLDLLDAQSTDDDGGGLGACVVTGVEHLGIPGRYERHYSKAPLQRLFEAAGWHVRECRDNTAAETGPGTEGTLIYVIAQVAAPAAAGDSCTDAEP